MKPTSGHSAQRMEISRPEFKRERKKENKVRVEKRTAPIMAPAAKGTILSHKKISRAKNNGQLTVWKKEEERGEQGSGEEEGEKI